jgi:hypothetical protein
MAQDDFPLRSFEINLDLMVWNYLDPPTVLKYLLSIVITQNQELVSVES